MIIDYSQSHRLSIAGVSDYRFSAIIDAVFLIIDSVIIDYSQSRRSVALIIDYFQSHSVASAMFN